MLPGGYTSNNNTAASHAAAVALQTLPHPLSTFAHKETCVQEYGIELFLGARLLAAVLHRSIRSADFHSVSRMAMFSRFFVLGPRGDTLVVKEYQGHISPKIATPQDFWSRCAFS